MLTEFNFHLTQVEYVRAAMLQAPAYKPDDFSADAVASLIGAAKTVRAEYISKFNALGFKRGATQSALTKLHEACVSVYQCMKSVFRKEPSSLHAIDGLPTQDQSLDETQKRAQAISDLWAKLPNPPAWSGPFKVGTMDLAAFDGLALALEAAERLEKEAEQAFELREGLLHTQHQTLADFAAAALAQGRGQFAEGTPEREMINRVPTAPATLEPGQAVVSLAQSPSAGAVRLEFNAPHATTFQVWRKGPGDDQFAQVADDVVQPGVYTAGGLPAGAHQFRIVPVNSRGEGPASEVVEVAVAAEAVA
jgi:hypothetical protein